MIGAFLRIVKLRSRTLPLAPPAILSSNLSRLVFVLSLVFPMYILSSSSPSLRPACAREIRFLLFREAGCVREVIGRRTSSSVATRSSNFADDRQDRAARIRLARETRLSLGGGRGGEGGREQGIYAAASYENKTR